MAFQPFLRPLLSVRALPDLMVRHLRKPDTLCKTRCSV